MVKFALEMLWVERKKSVGLCISMLTTLCICVLFLQFFTNPYLAKEITYSDIMIFGESILIALMGIFVLLVCISLISYACNYHMKLHSREIGMIKLAGFNQKQIILYQLIQTAMIMLIAMILCTIISLVTIPLFLWIVYQYCDIHQNIFYYSLDIYMLMGYIVLFILLIVVSLQIRYINSYSVSSLIKNKYTTTYQEDTRVFKIPDFVYWLGYLLGLYTMYIGEELTAGFAVAACIGALSAYGLFYYFIPHTFTEMIEDMDLKIEQEIVLGDLALFMQQSKLLIVFIMLSVILIPTFIFSSTDMKLLHIALHMSAVLVSFLLSLSIVNRFDIDNFEKEGHYKNLCKMGMTEKEVKAISIKEGNGFYILLWLFSGVYILSIALTFILRSSINISLIFIVILEFLIPYILTQFIVYIKKRGKTYELYRN